MKKFSLISLGCPKNTVDSEKVVNHLIKNGLILVNENTSEEILIINTCAFIKDAVSEAKKIIRDAIKRKKAKEINLIAVIGCLVSRFQKEDLAQEFSGVDLWLSTKDEDQLFNKLNQIRQMDLSEENRNNVFTKITPFYYAYVKISEGCNNFCSYCTIPKIRGKYNSFKIEDIVAEVQNYVKLGVKEIILVAEDTTIWGIDFYKKPSLHILLENLVQIPDLPWIRVMYAHPKHVTNELISVMKKYPQICNYLDLPIQHVSDQILTKMNRKYTKSALEDLLINLKQEIPDIALRTSLILGFPGETEAEVSELLEFIARYEFDHLGCFSFSKEQDTLAGSFLEQVKSTVALDRIEKIMNESVKIKKKINQELLGKTFDVIYEGNQIARSFREAPEIDSAIFLPKNNDLLRGVFYQAKIIEFEDYDLIGEVEL
ncbi:MAG: 30S ribosomal protein S12 methylthiotransferase RimO [Candidatus Margulisiibacteriota bacterium]|jgi:ribosomal protein S12 methylthiotransferase